MPQSFHDSDQNAWLQKGSVRYCYRVLRHPQPQFEPTLFLSGAFQTMDSWSRFAKTFAPLTTVILVDPPGMGHADLLPPEYGVDFLAESIRELVDTEAFERINVVSASYGTPTAFRFAQLYPERVRHIVLGGTMKEIPEHVRDRVEASVASAAAGDRERLAEQVINGLLCRNPLQAVERRRVAERVLRSGLTRMSATELRQYVSNTTRLLQHKPLDLSRPVRGPEALVFTGEHDCFTVPGRCQEVAKAFESAWFTTVQRADHLFHIEQFEVVTALLMAFMQDHLVGTVEGCSPITRTGCPVVASTRHATSVGVSLDALNAY